MTRGGLCFTFTLVRTPLSAFRPLIWTPTTGMRTMEATRRKAVIVGGTIITGGLFGLSQAQTTGAQTDIELQSFTVPDTTESVESVSEVPINVTLRADWDSTGADTLELNLFAGLSESSATELTTESFEISQSGDDTFEISGDLLNTADVSKDMLDPTIGPSITLSIGIQTTLKGDNKELDTSELWDTAELTINDDVIEGTLQTGGRGEISVQ